MRPTKYGVGRSRNWGTNVYGMVQVVGADRRQVVCLFAVIQMKDGWLGSFGTCADKGWDPGSWVGT